MMMIRTLTTKSRAQTAALEPRVARRRTVVLRRTVLSAEFLANAASCRTGMGSRPSSHESRSRRSQSPAELSAALRASAAVLTIVARALARSRDVSAPVIPKKTSSGSRNWRGSTTPATRQATTTNLPARCVCRRIVGSSVRACCANEAMPAQEEWPESEDYDSDESIKSATTSVCGESDSEPLVTKRPALKIVAKESTATKAGTVSLFARSPLRRAAPARDVRWSLQPALQ
jgi:hypothetical protein